MAVGIMGVKDGLRRIVVGYYDMKGKNLHPYEKIDLNIVHMKRWRLISKEIANASNGSKVHGSLSRL
jgi:hypothetical protein